MSGEQLVQQIAAMLSDMLRQQNELMTAREAMHQQQLAAQQQQLAALQQQFQQLQPQHVQPSTSQSQPSAPMDQLKRAKDVKASIDLKFDGAPKSCRDGVPQFSSRLRQVRSLDPTLSDEMVIQAAALCFEGLAQKWWNGKQAASPNALPFTNLDDFLAAFEGRFAHAVDPENEARLALTSIKQGNRSVAAYYNAYAEQDARLPTRDAKDRVFAFVGGLSDTFARSQLLLNLPPNLEAAYDAAKKYEGSFRLGERAGRDAGPRQQGPVPMELNHVRSSRSRTSSPPRYSRSNSADRSSHSGSSHRSSTPYRGRPSSASHNREARANAVSSSDRGSQRGKSGNGSKPQAQRSEFYCAWCAKHGDKNLMFKHNTRDCRDPAKPPPGHPWPNDARR